MYPILTIIKSRYLALELKITMDRKEELHVIDVIKVNSEGEIVSIIAFLGKNLSSNKQIIYSAFYFVNLS